MHIEREEEWKSAPEGGQARRTLGSIGEPQAALIKDRTFFILSFFIFLLFFPTYDWKPRASGGGAEG